MAYPIRCFEPGSIYFVTNRCFQSRLLLRPSPRVNRIVGGVLARALHLFPGIDVFAFIVLSNHLHALVRARDHACLSDFIGYVEGNIARRVGALVGWSGTFWHRRFSAEPVLDDDALDQRLQYILAHGVKENLVEHASEWPGLHCVPELAHGLVRWFEWVDEAQFHRAERRRGSDAPNPSPSEFTTRYPLPLTVLPSWEHLSPEQRHDRARHLVESAELQAAATREGRPVLGAENVLSQDPLDKAAHTKRSPRPLCHASTEDARAAFRKAYRAFADAYAEASAAFRRGTAAWAFPAHSFRPPLPWRWAPSLSLGSPPLAAVGVT